jgi:hypothetical protein
MLLYSKAIATVEMFCEKRCEGEGLLSQPVFAAQLRYAQNDVKQAMIKPEARATRRTPSICLRASVQKLEVQVGWQSGPGITAH